MYVRITMLCLSLLLLLPLSVYAGGLTRHDAVARAITNNPNLAEAMAAENVAEQSVISAAGKHYPRLTFEASITQRQDPIPYIPAQSGKIGPHFSDSYASLGPVLTVPLYQGGQVQNGVRLAELRQRIQQDSAIITRNELIANTVTIYNKILQLEALVAASRQAVEALEQQRKNAKLLFDLGRIARVDLLKVEVQKTNEEQRLLALQEGLKNGSSTLRALMGEAVDPSSGQLALTDRLTDTDLAADFETGLALAKSKPKYKIFAKAVDDADLNRRVARGKLLPTINAVAGYQQQYGFNPGYNDGVWYVGGSLSLPIFDRSNYAEITRERLQKERTVLKLKAVENQIRLDLRVAQASLTESRKRIAATAQAVEQSRESFRIEQEKYGQGAGTMADLLLAQAAQSQAEANQTQALFDYNTAMLDWYKASGNMETYL